MALPLIIDAGRTKRLPAATALTVQNSIDLEAAGTLSIGTSTATALTLGSGGAGGVVTTVAGDLTVTGNETVNGTAVFNGNTVQFGDASTDIMTMKGRWGDNTDPDFIFQLDLDHAISIDPSTVETAGHSLTVTSAIGGAASGGANGGQGGTLTIAAATGGVGDATFTSGPGGVLVLSGGDAGAVGGAGTGDDGGNVLIDAGAATSGGTDGQIGIGSTTASAIVLGNGVDNPTITQVGSGQVALTGNVDAQSGLDVTNGNLTLDTNDLVINTNKFTVDGGTGNVSMDGHIIGTNDGTGILVGAVGTGASTGSALQFRTFTSAERDFLVAADGMVIYNVTTSQFEGRDDGTWKALGETTDLTGTTNTSFEVNNDAVAGTTDGDNCIILTDGDGGIELMKSRLCQDAAADRLYLMTAISTVTDGDSDRTTHLTLGPQGDFDNTVNDADSTLTFRGHTNGDAIGVFTETNMGVDAGNDLFYILPETRTVLSTAGVGTLYRAGQGAAGLTGGTAGAAGGNTTFDGGAGGDGPDDALGGAGGAVIITGGQGGSDGGFGTGGTGGLLTLNAGAGVAGASDGSINIGPTNATDIGLGNATNNTTITQTGSGQVSFTGNVDASAGLDVTTAALTAAAALTVSGGAITHTGAAIDLDPTGAFSLDMAVGNGVTITISDNMASALLIQEGANAYLDITTTDAGSVEQMTFGNATTNPDYVYVGTGLVDVSDGTLDVPPGIKFLIGGTALTTANFTGANVDTLLDGSNADALHSHAAAATGQSGFSVTAAAGNTFVLGNVVAIESDGGASSAFLADADGAGEIVECLGLAGGAAAPAASFSLVQTGEVGPILDAEWDSAPGVAQIGVPVYMSKTTPGDLTYDVSAFTTGDTVTQIGNVSFADASADTTKVAVNIRQSTLL